MTSFSKSDNFFIAKTQWYKFILNDDYYKINTRKAKNIRKESVSIYYILFSFSSLKILKIRLMNEELI